MRRLVSVDDLTADAVAEIFRLTALFKREGVPKSRRGDWALLFLEPSTRTRLSFEKALKALGFETYLFGAQGSSLKKGESLEDTLVTLSAQGFEWFVVRTPQNGVLKPLAEKGFKIVNAGDGTNEHPTQALIDAFTLKEVFGHLRDLKVLFVGDLTYSRVFRSGYKLLRKLGAAVGAAGPRSMRPPALKELGVKVFSSLDEGLSWCDAAVFLRVQRERQHRPLMTSERDYLALFGLTPERAEYLRSRGKYYLHPGPVNRGVEIAAAEVYGKNSLIKRQVENGPFVRASVAHLME